MEESSKPPEQDVEQGDLGSDEQPQTKHQKRHSFFSAVPLARRMQEGAWGHFQKRGRRSLERLKNRVSSRFLGKPINLYLAIVGVLIAIIATIVYVEVFLRPSWQNAREAIDEEILANFEAAGTTAVVDSVALDDLNYYYYSR